jgi:large subunit ribosomal protein L5
MADEDKKDKAPAAKAEGAEGAAKPKRTPAPAGGGKVKGDLKAKPKKDKKGPPKEPAPAPRLKKHYETVCRAGLKKQFKYSNDMAVPRITKAVVSMGIGDAHENAKKLEALLDDVETITGQRPAVCKAKQAIANFKLREGMAVGLRVTLRGARMWELLDRLITMVLPRMRDFRGLSAKSFDGRGNYSFGLPDQIVFPEVKTDRVEFYHGMNICVCTTARSDEQARELLRLLGIPFASLPVTIIGAPGKD